jgi:hypothetical protein
MKRTMMSALWLAGTFTRIAPGAAAAVFVEAAAFAAGNEQG